MGGAPGRTRAGCAGGAADVARDGDADLVLGSLDDPPVILVSEGSPTDRAPSVELRTPAPNTSGIGARETVTRATQSREMRSVPGYLSGADAESLLARIHAVPQVRLAAYVPHARIAAEIDRALDAAHRARSTHRPCA